MSHLPADFCGTAFFQFCSFLFRILLNGGETLLLATLQPATCKLRVKEGNNNDPSFCSN
jgi:hypothetical protein